MSAREPMQSPVVGVLLAAGRSRRMGTLKQLLRWPPNGDSTVVAASFDAIAATCDQMIVVLGHQAPDIIEALGDRAFRQVHGDGDTELLVSVRAGLSAAIQLDSEAAVMLHLADHPAVMRSTVTRLLHTLHAEPERAVIPEYDGRGGHPVLIPAALVDRLLRYHGSGGLRQFWRSHPDVCHRIAVADAGVVLDLDTPDEYERIVRGSDRR
jgi:CTP:molybdopterin cytidylyltransferase MocA